MEHKYSFNHENIFCSPPKQKHLTQKKPFLIAIEQKYSTPKTIICDHQQAKKINLKTHFQAPPSINIQPPKTISNHHLGIIIQPQNHMEVRGRLQRANTVGR
jgi:hypothetical protein